MQLPEKTAKMSRVFCEGVHHQQGGGVVGDNPWPAGSREAIAWQDGFYAAAGAVGHAVSTAYAVGQLVLNDGAVWACLEAGTTGASSPPTGDQLKVVDGTVTWFRQGAGTNVDLTCCGVTRSGSPPYVATHNA